jgi:hypothetical protein
MEAFIAADRMLPQDGHGSQGSLVGSRRAEMGCEQEALIHE